MINKTKEVLAYHAMVKSKNAHISAMMDVVPSDDGVTMVFHPNTSQSIVRDLIVFVNSLNDKNGLISPCFCYYSDLS